MPTIDVVADASVVLKWFHAEGEEEVEAARGLIEHTRRRAIAVSVLDLTAYEIGNALLRGRPGVGADRVSVVLDALGEICPRLTLSTAELAVAANLAEQHGLTMYDAAYAAAARGRGAVLATMDRDLISAGLGRRPSSILSDLNLDTSREVGVTWNDDDLARELGRYEKACTANGMAGSALYTYMDHARRFLRWRDGEYRPTGARSAGRPVPSAGVTVAELKRQAETYADVVRTAGSAESTIDTYYRHALFFIRWLEGDFEPGSKR